VAHPENNVSRIDGEDPDLLSSPKETYPGSPLGASPSSYRSHSLGRVCPDLLKWQEQVQLRNVVHYFRKWQEMR
jgi:hypothetical protein